MPEPTLLYIHGTGVRMPGHEATVRQIRSKVEELSLPCRFEDFLWGDLGVDFEGLSLPDPPERSKEEEAQAQRWQYLRIDPLFDLKLWCLPAPGQLKKVGVQSAWKSIGSYKPSEVLDVLLERDNLKELFASAWDATTGSLTDDGVPIPEKLFETPAANRHSWLAHSPKPLSLK